MSTALESAVAAARYNSNQKYAAREWVVEDVFALATMNGWLGPEKAHKSMLALLLAMHIASGKDFFGLHIPRARTVTYLDAENPGDEIDLRYQAMLLHFTPQEGSAIGQNLAIVMGRELIDQGVNIEIDNGAFWKSFAATYPAEVYFLDALQMFHSRNDISNRDIKNVLLKLRGYCGPSSCLVILHHTRKREDIEINRKRPVLLRRIGARIWSDKCLGAGVFKRLSDVIVCQERVEDRKGEEVTGETIDVGFFGRIIQDIPLIQLVPNQGYSYTLVKTLAASVKGSLDKLVAAGGPWHSKNAAAKALPLSRSQANAHVRELIRKGYLSEGAGGSVSVV
jgi:AAA domain